MLCRLKVDYFLFLFLRVSYTHTYTYTRSILSMCKCNGAHKYLLLLFLTLCVTIRAHTNLRLAAHFVRIFASASVYTVRTLWCNTDGVVHSVYNVYVRHFIVIAFGPFSSFFPPSTLACHLHFLQSLFGRSMCRVQCSHFFHQLFPVVRRICVCTLFIRAW